MGIAPTLSPAPTLVSALFPGGAILANASNSVNNNFSLTKIGSCFDFLQIRAVCIFPMPTLSHACRGAFHSRKRPSLGRCLGPPRFGERVATQILAPYGGDRLRNQGFPPPAVLLIVHAHMINVIGIDALQPSGEAGSAGRKPCVAATRCRLSISDPALP